MAMYKADCASHEFWTQHNSIHSSTEHDKEYLFITITLGYIDSFENHWFLLLEKNNIYIVLEDLAILSLVAAYFSVKKTKTL